MKLIVGLGNPGIKYENTRHNIGFKTIDFLINKLRDDYNFKLINKFNAQIIEIKNNQDKIILVKPLTYMNLSGEAIIRIVKWYKLDLEDILVIHDDLDLPVGKIRFRLKGGSGGHNGISSLIQHLGTENFKRIKIGIDRPCYGDVVNYVLTNFNKDEKILIDQVIIDASDGIIDWLMGTDFINVMNKYN